MSTPEHVAMIEATVARQRAFFQTGATRPVAVRVAALHKLKREMQARETILLDALYADLHKSHAEGYMCELGLNLDELGYLARKLPQWAKPQRHPTPLAQFCSSSYQLAEPYGVVLVMSPWNYPYLLSLDPLFGAIAAGNCVVLKPSAYAPNTSRAMAELIAAVFPPDWVTVIQGGREQNAALLEQKFDYIFFTGSVDVGKMVMEKASRHLTPVTLELGGKSPNIIFADVDLEAAVEWAMIGIFFNQGEVCCAGSRIIIEESIHDAFVKRFAERANAMTIGNPLDNPDMGPLVSEGQLRDVLGYVQKGIEEGATLVCGGERYTEGECAKGYFMHPTIFDNCTPDMTIVREEIFGPVVTIQTFQTEEEAIALANDTIYGLAGGVFTHQLERALRVVKEVRAGITWVNAFNPTYNEAPWGGYKMSGIGRELGVHGLEEYQEIKQVNINLTPGPAGWYEH